MKCTAAIAKEETALSLICILQGLYYKLRPLGVWQLRWTLIGALPSYEMAGSALKRLMQEYKGESQCREGAPGNTCDECPHAELTLNPPEGVVAGPKSEDNFFEWEALIT